MVFTAASVCQRSLYHKKINLETKISSVILLDQFQIFQNDGTRFLIRNIENFSVDQPDLRLPLSQETHNPSNILSVS